MGTGKAKKYHTASDTATDESGDDDDDQGSESGDITTDPETSEDEEAHDRKALDVVSKTSLEQDADQVDEYGDWLFESREYTEWVKYPQSLLWLYGNCRFSVPALLLSSTWVHVVNSCVTQLGVVNRCYGKVPTDNLRLYGYLVFLTHRQLIDHQKPEEDIRK